ncbi:MAG: PEP-CTERM sorting domain-containing protein [Brasilonema sp.]
MTISTAIKKLSMATAGAAFIALGTIGIRQAQATTIGADSFGYTATNDVPFIFEDISGTGTRMLAGIDDASASALLGFDFNFYGTNYNSVSFSTNGLISFQGGNFQYDNQNLTTTTVNGNLPSIAVLWDDLQFTSAGTDAVYFQTVGKPGHQRFITQWNSVEGFSDSPSPITFQAVLFEGSNDILLSYLDVNSGDSRSFGASSTVGIRDINGQTNGRNLQWSYNEPIIRNEQSIRFSSIPVSSVPEPSSMVGLLTVGIFSTGLLLKCKQQHKATAKI